MIELWISDRAHSVLELDDLLATRGWAMKQLATRGSIRRYTLWRFSKKTAHLMLREVDSGIQALRGVPYEEMRVDLNSLRSLKYSLLGALRTMR